MDNVRKKIKAVIFDMDDTIIKTGHLWELVTKRTLKKYGISEFSHEEQKVIDSLIGVGLDNAVLTIKKMFNLPDSVEQICKRKLVIADKLFESKIEFIDGFEDFHKSLCFHNIQSGIATNAPTESLNKIVKVMNLEKKFMLKLKKMQE